MVHEFSYDALYVGQECEFSYEVTQEKQRLFYELSGDCNPLHLDTAFAQEKGYQDCVVYGMLVASLYSTLAGVYLPGKHCLLQSVDTAFIKPVFVGDILRVQGKLIEKIDLFHQVVIKAAVFRKKGEKVCRAIIKAGVLQNE